MRLIDLPITGITGSSPMSVGWHGAPCVALTGVGVEVPEDHRTSTSSDVKDLDNARAYVVLPRSGWLLRPL